MLSFDISDRQINVVKGANVSGKIRIEKSLVIKLPEDLLSNAEVLNLSQLSDLILKNLKAENMMDKEAIVTFSSSSIVFKEIVVPKAKSGDLLQMVQNHMSQEMGITDEYSISYTVVGEAGADQAGGVKVLATACPSAVVEGFRKLFANMQINLKSVNIGCNSISRIVLADKTNLQKMPLLVCQIDENFLGLTLFENGQMAFSRFVPISPEDYESDDYVLEALNENIFRMEQFNKARGGNGLSNVILYGFIDDYIKIVDALDGLNIKASVLGVPSQITGYENFEFTVFANAIGALYKRDKSTERINLLEVDSSTGKGGSGVSSLLVTAGVFVGVSAIIIGAATAFIHMKESSVRNEIKDINVEIDKCNQIIAANQVLKNKKLIIDSYASYAKKAKENLESQPVINTKAFEDVDKKISDNKGAYESFNFNVEEGSITIGNIQVDKQETVKKLVDDLDSLDFVGDVIYTGYEGTGEKAEDGKNDPVVIKTLIVYMKGAAK